MHRSIFASLTLIACGGICAVALPTKSVAGPTIAPSTQPVNTKCPVMDGEKIDPKVTYVYKDKTIGFCCDDCIPEFKKDPEKYVKDMK